MKRFRLLVLISILATLTLTTILSFITSAPTPLTIYFCPADPCQQAILNEITAAHTSIDFLAYSFTDPNIRDALIAQYYHGRTIRGIAQQPDNAWTVLDDLTKKGIPIIYVNNTKGLMHEKVFIIDNATVITGSYNPTRAAYQHNNENILIIRDKHIAALYLAEFNHLSAVYNKPSPTQ